MGETIASETRLGGTWALVPSSLMTTLSLLCVSLRLLGWSSGGFSHNEDLHRKEAGETREAARLDSVHWKPPGTLRGS